MTDERDCDLDAYIAEREAKSPGFAELVSEASEKLLRDRIALTELERQLLLTAIADHRAERTRTQREIHPTIQHEAVAHLREAGVFDRCANVAEAVAFYADFVRTEAA